MTAIIYHDADFDGKCSAIIAKSMNTDAHLIGMDYGRPFPWEELTPNETVIMVDFSFNKVQDMLTLATRYNLIWIDHHKTAIDKVKECFRALNQVEPAGARDIGKAACELCWQFFRPREAMPLAVNYLGRFDVWDHSNKYTLPFQYGMRLLNPGVDDMELWQSLFNDPYRLNAIIDDGVKLQRYEDAGNAELCKNAYTLLWRNLRWLVLNTHKRSSLIFKSIYDPVLHDAMMCIQFNGKSWRYSIYSEKPGVDVGAIAKELGGGGHTGAAGFEMSPTAHQQAFDFVHPDTWI